MQLRPGHYPLAEFKPFHATDQHLRAAQAQLAGRPGVVAFGGLAGSVSEEEVDCAVELAQEVVMKRDFLLDLKGLGDLLQKKHVLGLWVGLGGRRQGGEGGGADVSATVELLQLARSPLLVGL